MIIKKLKLVTLSRLLIVILSVGYTVAGYSAEQYLDVGISTFKAEYSDYAANLTAYNFRMGSYLSTSTYMEGVVVLGGDENQLASFGTTNNVLISVFGRPSAFDSLTLKLKVQSMLGVYTGWMYQASKSVDLTAKAGLVYLSYSQTINARNATIEGFPFSSRYSETIGGSVIGLSVGFGANYFFNRQTSLSVEVVSLPSVEDTLLHKDSSGSTVISNSYSDVSAYAVNVGLRLHF